MADGIVTYTYSQYWTMREGTKKDFEEKLATSITLPNIAYITLANAAPEGGAGELLFYCLFPPIYLGGLYPMGGSLAALSTMLVTNWPAGTSWNDAVLNATGKAMTT